MLLAVMALELNDDIGSMEDTADACGDSAKLGPEVLVEPTVQERIGTGRTHA